MPRPSAGAGATRRTARSTVTGATGPTQPEGARADRDGDRGRVEELVCDGIAHGGEAVGRLADGRAVFVPHAIPGERVRIRVTQARRRFARAELVEVLEPSPDRVEPPCPHFGPGRCGGCAWQHIRREAQADLKARLVLEQLAHIGGLTGVPVRPTLLPASPPDEPAGFGYRERATLTAGPDGRLGFLRSGSHAVHPVDRCPLLAAGLQDLPAQLGRHPRGAKVRLRHGADGDRLIVLEAAASRARFFSPEDTSWAAVRANGKVVDGQGQPSVIERIAGVDLHVSAASFFQVHRQGAETLVELAGCALRPAAGDILLDLYAGVGLFAGTVGAAAGKVVAVESWKPAARDARHNLRSHPDATVLQDDVANALERIAAADLVILDPPRSGAGAGVLQRVAALAPRAIALVSCDPAALARDVRSLTDLGYHAAWVQPVDLFPQTAHVEALTALYPAGQTPRSRG